MFIVDVLCVYSLPALPKLAHMILLPCRIHYGLSFVRLSFLLNFFLIVDCPLDPTCCFCIYLSCVHLNSQAPAVRAQCLKLDRFHPLTTYQMLILTCLD
jgi:hypothetical protein